MYFIEIIMGTNEIQILVIKNVKSSGQNCLDFVRKYPYHLCCMLFVCVLCMFSPLVFTVLAYCFPVVGLAFFIHRVFIRKNRQKVKNVGSKPKSWKELQSRRSFRRLDCAHVPKPHNESSFMQDVPGVRQNALERSNGNFDNMSTKNKDVLSTTFDDHLIDEKYRKCSFDNDKEKLEESMDLHDDKEKRKDHGNKTVHWMDEEEKSLMDLGISEAERTKRLECLMERRRSRKVISTFQNRRNAMGVGIGNNSCSQISSLVIPKNPFLSRTSSDADSSAPGSAPTCMIKDNPFDIPYDAHEEKPILTGDSFEDEQSSLRNISPPKSASCNNEPTFDIDFAFKQLRRLGTSRLAKKEDDKKQAEQESSIPKNVTDDANRAIKEGEASEKVVNAVSIFEETGGTEASSKEHHDISSNQSTSSSCSSEDEPILRRPNKEAILHCLSMSRMRIVSQGSTILRNAESFDCGPSALCDKTKTDGFFFGANKRIHYGSTNSVASDMQVEVSDIGSPTSTNLTFDEDSKGSFVNSTNPSELDLRLRDIDEVNEQDIIDSIALESDERPIVLESLDHPVPHNLPLSENDRFQQK